MRFRAVAVECVDGAEVGLLARGWCRSASCSGRRCERAQRQARAVGILLVPYLMCVRQRFTPVGHRKARVEALCVAEGRSGGAILEAVHEQHTANERWLCNGRTGRWKGDGAELLRVRCCDRQ